MRKKFNKREIKELSQNENVKKCGECSITYTDEFKVEAVKQYKKGLTATQIFKDAGFDFKTIGNRRPESSLRAWRKIMKKEGLSKLRNRKRGGRKKKVKTKDKTERDKMERLEAENAYLREENSFLAKLRAEEERN